MEVGLGWPPVTAVLFTCAGQRVDIVSAFGRAGATTIATDVNALAPALYHADRYALVGRVDDPEYVQQLRDLVAAHDVRLVVPLTDLDQHVLAGADLGTTVLLSDAHVVEAMSDKYLAHEFLLERGIPSPSTWLPEDLPAAFPLPALVKARVGFGRATSTARRRARSSTSSWRTRPSTRWCRNVSPARSSRSTSSAISTAAASTRSRAR